MTHSVDDDDDPPPVGMPPSGLPRPANAKQRTLLVIVIILGVLILLAFAVLVVGLITGLGKSSQGGPSAPTGTPWRADLAVPPGGRVGSWQVEGNRATVHLILPGREEIVFIDASTGKITGRVEIRPTPQPHQ